MTHWRVTPHFLQKQVHPTGECSHPQSCREEVGFQPIVVEVYTWSFRNNWLFLPLWFLSSHIKSSNHIYFKIKNLSVYFISHSIRGFFWEATPVHILEVSHVSTSATTISDWVTEFFVSTLRLLLMLIHHPFHWRFIWAQIALLLHFPSTSLCFNEV